ncbi:MAG: hypothetical protein ACP5I6_02330 [Caldisphaera sp.]|jgi:hypothetical protein|nr:MAG: hypothetical protein C0201_02155 [Caldisphaera sp.]PMP89781.1 MAG: hypothetical protein C0171_06345 [Caldisphaera sp.]
MNSYAELEVIFEDPALLISGFNSIKKFIDNLECVSTNAPSWIIASCKDIFIKSMIIFEENITIQSTSKANINIRLEGDTEKISKITSELIKIVKDSGGGLLLKA